MNRYPCCGTTSSRELDGPMLPAKGVLRLEQIIGDPDADPPIYGLIPLRKSQWYAIASQRGLRKIALGKRARGFLVEELMAVMADMGVTFSNGRPVRLKKPIKHWRSQNEMLANVGLAVSALATRMGWRDAKQETS